MDHTIDELHTLADVVRWGASQFNKNNLYFGHGTDNAIDEAVALVLHALSLPHDLPDPLWYARLTYPEKQHIIELFQKRVQKRIPVAYLTNQAWFAGLDFYVDQRVLIPRSPIAELIEQHFTPWVEPETIHRMLDLCTGSGCIAIASAILAFPQAEIDAVDVSLDALEVTKRNIKNYGLSDNVHAVHSDLFHNLHGIHYDLIVCNPPYVDEIALKTMPTEYHHEPRIGLEAGKDGLSLVRQILKEAKKHLTSTGVLIVEVGASQPALEAAYPDVPFTWLDFKRGGEGVFLLTAQHLEKYF